MLLAVDAATSHFAHRCEACHVARQGLRCDPALGDLAVMYDNSVACNLVVTCPACGTGEIFRLVAPAEAGEGLHPDSLVGRRFADTGGVVVEHNVDGSGHPHHREQARLILALARQPHLAPRLASHASPKDGT